MRKLLATVLLIAVLGALPGASVPASLGAEREADAAAATLALDWAVTGDLQGAQFGYAVGAAGDVNGDNYPDVIVGAPNKEGQAFVYHGSPQGLIEGPADWSADGDQWGDWFGRAVSAAGDFNGDGYGDVIVGAYLYNNELTEQNKVGAALVYFGSHLGLSSSPGWIAYGPHQDSYFGYAVGAAGDVNADGVDDVIVGARGYANGEAGEGAIFVYYGAKSATPSETAAWSFESNQVGAMLGWSVAGAGDVDGDGVSDIIAGLPGYDGELAGVGAAMLFFGSDSGLAATPDWMVEGEQPGGEFGAAVAGAGDVNGDSRDDVVIGAPSFDKSEVETSVGQVYLYYGTASGPEATAGWSASQGGSYARFGHAVGGAGDINGDTYADLVVGAPGWERDQQLEGAVFVYLGSPAGPGAAPAWRGEGDKAEARLGSAAGAAGDVNKDGLDDIIAGAPDYKISTNPYGRACAYHSTGSIVYSHAAYLPLVVK